MKIIEKYKELNKACKRYPRINLGTKTMTVPVEECINDIAENGFIEVFCLSKEEQEKVREKRMIKK